MIKNGAPANGRLYLYKVVVPVEVTAADGETLQIPDHCCLLSRRPLADDAFQLLRLFGSGITELDETEFADTMPPEIQQEARGKKK